MNILLAVSGSISAYKSLEVLRFLVKAGHQVKVILTQGALKFVVPDSYRYLGALNVYLPQSDFDLNQYGPDVGILHIDLARWADEMIVAPLSANTLARLAQAQAQDLLSSVFLAMGEKPIVLFPAMNTKMWEHPLLQKNLQLLAELPQLFVHPPDKGELACGEIGEGKLPTPEVIARFSPLWNLKRRNERILITCGPTVAPLDTFRYLTNASSGKTGLYLAEQALAQGLDVSVVAGPGAHELFTHLMNHPHFELFHVRTTQEMQQAVLARIEESHFFISAAAVCDFEFETAEGKLKKEDFSGTLYAKKAVDILKSVVERRAGLGRLKKIVGFAAESSLSPELIRKKMSDKPVDLLVGNVVDHGLSGKGQGQGFGQEAGDYLLHTSQSSLSLSALTKKELAERILHFCLNTTPGNLLNESAATTQ